MRQECGQPVSYAESQPPESQTSGQGAMNIDNPFESLAYRPIVIKHAKFGGPITYIGLTPKEIPKNADFHYDSGHEKDTIL